MNGLVRIESAKLALLGTEDLAKAVDSAVKSAIRAVETAAAECNALRAEVDSLPAGTDAPELYARLNTAVAKRREAVAAIEGYVEEQRALFRSKGLDENRAYAEAIVPTGELTPAGTEIFRIVKRGESLEPADPDEDEGMASVRASKSFSDRVGLSDDQRRGKYNDAAILIDQSSCSVDPGEVAEWSRACL